MEPTEPKKLKRTRADWQEVVAELEMDRLEVQMDLEGCEIRLSRVREQLSKVIQDLDLKDKIIARQRDWIVTLEKRLALVETENAELRGEGDDEAV